MKPSVQKKTEVLQKQDEPLEKKKQELITKNGGNGSQQSGLSGSHESAAQ